MQLRYVGSELFTGLRRNVSMTVAVILTIWISLTLVGFGLLTHNQIGTIEKFLGSEVEVRVSFCARNSLSPQCVSGRASRQQERSVKRVIQRSANVSSYRFITRQENFDGFRRSHLAPNGREDPIAAQVKQGDMPTQYSVKFKDPNKTADLTRKLQHLSGVDRIVDLRSELAPVYEVLGALQWLALGGAGLLVLAAVLQVSNTIRLAALARRREIGIMRLVGASSVYIQLPFVLEVVFSALVGAGLACLSVVGAMTIAIPKLRGTVGFWPWIDWNDAWQAMTYILVIAVGLAVIPTLVMTRKYLNV